MQFFYHGTQKAVAYSIMQQGFKIGGETMGRNLGAGLYLTARVGFAAVWGPIIIVCRLVLGTRILWHTPVDLRTIAYLKKEFGAGILKPDFHKLLPRNKQLTKVELAQLWNYLVARYYLDSRRSRRNPYLQLRKQLAHLYKFLKRHGYDGFGMRDPDWPEIFLFNPSKALPLSAHTFTSGDWIGWEKQNVKLSEPLSREQLRDMQEQASAAKN